MGKIRKPLYLWRDFHIGIEWESELVPDKRQDSWYFPFPNSFPPFDSKGSRREETKIEIQVKIIYEQKFQFPSCTTTFSMPLEVSEAWRGSAPSHCSSENYVNYMSCSQKYSVALWNLERWSLKSFILRGTSMWWFQKRIRTRIVEIEKAC